MPFLESTITALIQASGGVDGGLTALQLAELAHAPLGRVRMMLRRMQDRGTVYIAGGSGLDTRYLLSEMRGRTRPPPRPDDFGWGRTDTPRPGGWHTSGLHDTDAELERLRSEVERLRLDNQHLRDALTRGGGGPEGEVYSRLDDLIKLCHPDRHDNSTRANTTTQWLLELRKRRR